MRALYLRNMQFKNAYVIISNHSEKNENQLPGPANHRRSIWIWNQHINACWSCVCTSVNLFEMRCELQVAKQHCRACHFFTHSLFRSLSFNRANGLCLFFLSAQWGAVNCWTHCNFANRIFQNNQMVFVILFDFGAISWHFGRGFMFFFSVSCHSSLLGRTMSNTHFNSVW